MPTQTDEKPLDSKAWKRFKLTHIPTWVLEPDGTIHPPLPEGKTEISQRYKELSRKYKALRKEHLALLETSNQVLKIFTQFKTMTPEQLHNFLDNKPGKG